jgi:hypothetical protein
MQAPKHHEQENYACQDGAHTFIARFWLEPRELKGKKPIWRGMIEHVASGQRKYLEDLEEIKNFIWSLLHKS